MHVVAEGKKVLLKVGRTFTAHDAERMMQLLEPLVPFPELVLDFTNVHEFHNSALPSLFKAMKPLVGVRVALRGLTEHQSRLLKYLGLPAPEFSMGA